MMEENRKAIVTGIRVELDDGRTTEIPGGETVAIFMMNDTGDAMNVNTYLNGVFGKNELSAMASSLEDEFGNAWQKVQAMLNLRKLINDLEKPDGKEADEEQT